MKQFNWIVFGGFLFLVSCGNNEEAVSPEKRKITETVYASGILVPENEYILRAQTEGSVSRIFYAEGDSIQAGKTLLEINNERIDADFMAASEIYNTTVKSTGNTSPALAELEARLSASELKFKTDSLNFGRFKRLLAENAVSQSEFEQAELRYKQSLSEVRGLRLQAESLRYAQRNELSRAKGTYLQTGSLGEYRRPKAAYDALIYEINKKTGDYVRPGEALALLGSGDLIARLKIDESDFAKIKPGQKVLISGDVFEDRIIEGKVIRVLPKMNEREQSFTVEVSLPELSLASVYGLNVEADIIITENREALLISKSYLLPGDSVIVQKGNETQKVKVRTGMLSGEYVEILEGLNTESKILKK